MTSAAAVTGGIIIAVRLFVSQSEAAGSSRARDIIQVRRKNIERETIQDP